MCGEKRSVRPSMPAYQGSPPRVRGKVFFSKFASMNSGITPACAGKRRPSGRRKKLGRDHPRVCGEKRPCPHADAATGGSPPRVRGKVHRAPEIFRAARITHACAGKRTSRLNAGSKPKDHPRVCGEKLIPCLRNISEQGSPPRVRGKGTQEQGGHAGRGITPACAGKRPWSMLSPRARRDHPRVCGEKHLVLCLVMLLAGSPPRVRGKDDQWNFGCL